MAASGTRTISTRMLVPFARALDALDLTAEQRTLLVVEGNVDEWQRPDGRIRHKVAVDLLRLIVQETGVAEIGLLAAERVTAPELDVFEYAAKSQPTLGKGLESMCRLVSLLHDGSSMHIETHGDQTEVRWVLDPSLQTDPALAEFGLAMVVLAWRRYLSKGLPLVEARFAHAAPADTSHHARVLQCPVRFDAPSQGILMPTDQLALPLPQADLGLAHILNRHAEAMMEQLPSPSLVDRVKQLIGSGLARNEVSTDWVARALHTSPRTLHRRLKDNGSSFRELVDEVRHKLALRYLFDNRLAIGEVAFLLGFATPNAFHKAFKRWTGTTASAYRQSANNEA